MHIRACVYTRVEFENERSRERLEFDASIHYDRKRKGKIESNATNNKSEETELAVRSSHVREGGTGVSWKWTVILGTSTR